MYSRWLTRKAPLSLARPNIITRSLRTVVRRFYERDDPEFHKQSELLRIKSLRHIIDRGIHAKYSHRAIEELVRSRLAQSQFRNPSRLDAFVTVIGAFLQHRMAQAALNMADTMTEEGFVPDPSFTIRLKPLYLLTERVSNQTRVEKIEGVFQSPLYQEGYLLELLDISEASSGKDLTKAILQAYEKVRGEISTNIPELFKHVARWSSNPFVGTWTYQEPQGHTERRAKRRLNWYSDVLRSAWAVSTGTALKVSNEIISDLNRSDIGPDIRLVNNLITVQLKHHRYDRALSLYRLATAQPKHRSMFPNGRTFRLMFSAIINRTGPRIARRQRGPFPQSDLPMVQDEFINTRSLFKTMTKYHRMVTMDNISVPSRIINILVLHEALRAFLREKDYSGAYAVVRSMHRYHTPLTVATYRIVLGHVADRIQNEEHATPSDCSWAALLLGAHAGKFNDQATWSLFHPQIYGLLSLKLHMPTENLNFDRSTSIIKDGALNIPILASQLQSFIQESAAQSYKLPRTLGPHERAQAHRLAAEFGLKSLSSTVYFNGTKHRQVKIYKASSSCDETHTLLIYL